MEFSAAAFRFAHSQVRSRYQLNTGDELIHILVPSLAPNPFQHLGGFRPLPKGWRIEWDLFFAMGGSSPPARPTDRHQDDRLVCSAPRGRRPGTPIAGPARPAPGPVSGAALRPAVAATMGTSVPDADLDLHGDTPLWYYLLREAEVVEGGRRLGPSGGRIVAEILLGMLAADPASYLHASPTWALELPSEDPDHFTMADLSRFAGQDLNGNLA